MRESAGQLTRLQELIDRSIAGAGPFLRNAFEMPERSLSAQQLVERLDGARTVALATTTARGEPRVAPIGALFVHVPSVAQADPLAPPGRAACREADRLFTYAGEPERYPG